MQQAAPHLALSAAPSVVADLDLHWAHANGDVICGGKEHVVEVSSPPMHASPMSTEHHCQLLTAAGLAI